MTSTQRSLRIGNVSASRTDRATATAEFLSAASLDVLALDMLSDEAMLELAEQRAQGDPGHERALLVQLGECLDLVGTGACGSSPTRAPSIRVGSPRPCVPWPPTRGSSCRWHRSTPVT